MVAAPGGRPPKKPSSRRRSAAVADSGQQSAEAAAPAGVNQQLSAEIERQKAIWRQHFTERLAAATAEVELGAAFLSSESGSNNLQAEGSVLDYSDTLSTLSGSTAKTSSTEGASDKGNRSKSNKSNDVGQQSGPQDMATSVERLRQDINSGDAVNASSGGSRRSSTSTPKQYSVSAVDTGNRLMAEDTDGCADAVSMQQLLDLTEPGSQHCSNPVRGGLPQPEQEASRPPRAPSQTTPPAEAVRGWSFMSCCRPAAAEAETEQREARLTRMSNPDREDIVPCGFRGPSAR